MSQKWLAGSEAKWLKIDSKMGSGVTFGGSLLGHFGVGLPESLLGHFNSLCVSVELGARPLHNTSFYSGSFSTRNPQVCWFYFLNLAQKEKSLLRKPDSPYYGSESLGNCSGSDFCPCNKFSIVRICIRDLVADGKSLVRNSGVGGGVQNLILVY